MKWVRAFTGISCALITLSAFAAVSTASEPARCESVSTETVSTETVSTETVSTETVSTETVSEILSDFQKAQSEYRQKMRGAKSEEEREALSDERPRERDLAPRLWNVAENSKEPSESREALLWIFDNIFADDHQDRSLAKLLDDHGDDPELWKICETLSFSQVKGVSEALSRLLEKSPHRNVQGHACYALAKREADFGGGGVEKRVAYLERLIGDYSDVRLSRHGTLGEFARGELFEVRNLEPGMVAPDIEGVDESGNPFRLSEYRGKVVFLVFWAHW